MKGLFSKKTMEEWQNLNIDIKLSNPKTYRALMLFFGCLFVFLGTLAGNYVAPNLTQYGWILIGISVCLWLVPDLPKRRRYRY
jgi:hypothetical protein